MCSQPYCQTSSYSSVIEDKVENIKYYFNIYFFVFFFLNILKCFDF